MLVRSGSLDLGKVTMKTGSRVQLTEDQPISVTFGSFLPAGTLGTVLRTDVSLSGPMALVDFDGIMVCWVYRSHLQEVAA